MKNSGLQGKSVLITGASSGIGWAAAEAFARAGCRVALAARRPDKLRKLAQALKNHGIPVLELTCDVRERDQVSKAIEETLRNFKTLDILVNNAGILETKRFEEQDISSMEDILKTNVLGAIYAIQAVLPAMRRQGQGHIVNVASAAGIIGLPFMAVYCASKFALVGLTEALRRELYGTGITLTALCPGLVQTPMTENLLKDPDLAKRARPKTAQQVAQKILYAVRKKVPEIIYGETPGACLYLSKFFPKLTDRAVHMIYSSRHPLARKNK